MDTELRTARLVMRRTRPEDLDGLHALASDFEVVKQTSSWPWPADRAYTATRAEPMAPEIGMGGPVFAGDVLVGMMGATSAGGSPELGYMFAPAHWGRGYATEMGRALIAHCWARYDWPAIAADVLADNPASARVLLKLGFVEGPAGTGPSAAQGGVFPTRTFRLVRPARDG
ncbi:GNAT family N-acetyltransferase [Sinisalibacter aestuarii]|uniref:N-acetyltransferase n=1 Tax=Sinisalibacter aestuarii TaxID=2949426 RepID=A0ABQ5LSD8_9RHOB|nr:GNAT family N-acetyltransferase [Sinisalibacter aestuarii]GKY87920.1 N-acetyltransferase [Sinisalibacter aestuarii]